MAMATAVDGYHVPNGQLFTFDMGSVDWQMQQSLRPDNPNTKARYMPYLHNFWYSDTI